jgi:hypothetical protein
MVAGSQHQRHPRAHDEHGTVVLTNQLGVMVDRCKRFCERYLVATENDSNVKNGYEGIPLFLAKSLTIEYNVSITNIATDSTGLPPCPVAAAGAELIGAGSAVMRAPDYGRAIADLEALARAAA